MIVLLLQLISATAVQSSPPTKKSITNYHDHPLARSPTDLHDLATVETTVENCVDLQCNRSSSVPLTKKREKAPAKV